MCAVISNIILTIVTAMSRSFLLQVLNKGAHLLQAAESGDVERVKQMMADFVDVNTRNEVCLLVFID